MKYICLSCGTVFRQPWVIEDRHGEPRRAGERYGVSPCCGEDFAAARACGDCGRMCPEEEMLHGLCAGCAEAAVERLRGYLRSAFTKEQREVLNDAFDAVALTQAERAQVRRECTALK